MLFYLLLNVRDRKLKGQSRMDNPATLATLGKQAKTGSIDTEDTCNIGHRRHWQYLEQKTHDEGKQNKKSKTPHRKL